MRTPLFLAAIAVIIVLGACAAPGGVAVLATSIVGVAALAFAWRVCRPSSPDDRRFFASWTGASVALHAGIGLVVAAIPAAVDYLGPDAVRYDRWAHELAQHWANGAPSPVISSGKELFAYALGGLYLVLGRHVAAGIVFNAFCAGALVLVVSDTTRRIGGERAARVAAPLAVLLPGFVLWPSLLLREASVFLLVAIAINAALRLVERMTLARSFVVAVSIALLFSNRASVAAVLAFSLMIGDVLARRRLLASALAILVTGAMTALIMISLGTGAAGFRYIIQLDFGDVSALRKGLNDTARSGTGDHDIVTAAVDFGIGPLPWQVTRASEAPGAVDGLVMILLIPSFVRGLIAASRRSRSRVFVLVVPAALLFGILALIGGNFGFIVRERPQVLVIILPFIALGITEHPRWKRRHSAAIATT